MSTLKMSYDLAENKPKQISKGTKFTTKQGDEVIIDDIILMHGSSGFYSLIECRVKKNGQKSFTSYNYLTDEELTDLIYDTIDDDISGIKEI